ncbi:MAG: glutaredoxin domain-containing protein [Acidimicrobiia bacterium]
METAKPVTVYWRPGCGFCAALFMRLDEAGIAHDLVNIWEDDDARTFVRSVANGNETVPTVTVGTEAFVNPSVQEVQRALDGKRARGIFSRRRN